MIHTVDVHVQVGGGIHSGMAWNGKTWICSCGWEVPL